MNIFSLCPNEHTSEGGRDDRGVPYHAESTLSSAQVLKKLTLRTFSVISLSPRARDERSQIRFGLVRPHPERPSPPFLHSSASSAAARRRRKLALRSDHPPLLQPSSSSTALETAGRSHFPFHCCASVLSHRVSALSCAAGTPGCLWAVGCVHRKARGRTTLQALSDWLLRSDAGGFASSMERAGVRVLFPSAEPIAYRLRGGRTRLRTCNALHP